jgi:hypothetical protein
MWSLSRQFAGKKTNKTNQKKKNTEDGKNIFRLAHKKNVFIQLKEQYQHLSINQA